MSDTSDASSNAGAALKGNESADEVPSGIAVPVVQHRRRVTAVVLCSLGVVVLLGMIAVTALTLIGGRHDVNTLLANEAEGQKIAALQKLINLKDSTTVPAGSSTSTTSVASGLEKLKSFSSSQIAALEKLKAYAEPHGGVTGDSPCACSGSPECPSIATASPGQRSGGTTSTTAYRSCPAGNGASTP